MQVIGCASVGDVNFCVMECMQRVIDSFLCLHSKNKLNFFSELVVSISDTHCFLHLGREILRQLSQYATVVAMSI